MSATAAEVAEMVTSRVQGALDLPDRLFEAGAGRHEAYLVEASRDKGGEYATYQVFERGVEGAIATVTLSVEVTLA